MTDLFPTLTRRKLLTAVHRQRVTRSPAGVVMRRGDHGFKTRAEAAVREVEARRLGAARRRRRDVRAHRRRRVAMGGPT